MHKFIVKLTEKCVFTVKLTVISIFKFLREKQVKIECSLICPRNLALKNHRFQSCPPKIHWFTVKLTGN